jgi:hypothetical protein
MKWMRFVFGIVLAGSLLPRAASAQGMVENTAEACQDGVDNDADGFSDCADQDCSFFKFCAVAVEPEPEPEPEPPPPVAPPKEDTPQACQDGVDNDADGYADCADQDCTFFVVCSQPPAPGPTTQPGAAAEPEPVPKPPKRRSKGGIGIFFAPTFVLASKHHFQTKVPYGTESYDEDWDYAAFSPGVGLFGEYAATKIFTIGFEGFLAFPKLETLKITKGGGAYDGMEFECWEDINKECGRDVLFTGLVRFKLTIPAGVAEPYPIFGVGLSVYSIGERDYDVVTGEKVKAITMVGPSAAVGFGVQFNAASFFVPYLELRYLFDININKKKSPDTTDWVMHNSLVLQLGARFAG